jgi:hypothetical protein
MSDANIKIEGIENCLQYINDESRKSFYNAILTTVESEEDRKILFDNKDTMNEIIAGRKVEFITSFEELKISLQKPNSIPILLQYEVTTTLIKDEIKTLYKHTSNITHKFYLY